MSSARNHGIREARGEYITFLDSDDWFEDDAVEILLAAQLDYPDKIIIANFYNNVKLDNNNEITRQPLNSPDKASRFVSMKETAEVFCWFSELKGFHSMPARLFETKILRENNINFCEHISYSEDALFTFTYMQYTTGAFYVSELPQLIEAGAS